MALGFTYASGAYWRRPIRQRRTDCFVKSSGYSQRNRCRRRLVGTSATERVLSRGVHQKGELLPSAKSLGAHSAYL